MIISLFPHGKATAATEELSVEKLLSRIKTGFYKSQVATVRACSDKASRSEAKIKLPSPALSGTFSHRSKAGLLQHSGLIALDIDADDNPGLNLTEARRRIEADPYTLACFVSVGGAGLCVLVRIPTEAHEESFRALETYYREEFGLVLDAACKDVSRLRFVSYDPLLFHNPEAAVFDVVEGPPAPKLAAAPAKAAALVAEYRAGARGEGYGQLALRRACEKVQTAPDGQKHGVLNKIAFLCGGYVGSGFLSETEARDALQATISGRDVVDMKQAFRTVDDGLRDGQLKPILPDPVKLYAHKQFREGKAPADVAAALAASQGLPVEMLTVAMVAEKQALSEQPELLTWWDVVDPGNDKPLKLLISKHRYRAWLATAGGFRRLHDASAPDGSIVVQVVNNVVRRVSRVDITAFVKNYIEDLPFAFDGVYRSHLEEQFENMQRVLLSMEGMQLLPELAGDFLRDTASTHYAFYRNCWVAVTAEARTVRPYAELPGLIWEEQRTSPENREERRKTRDFTLCSDQIARTADVAQFIGHLTAGDPARLDQLQRAFGYLVHAYKDDTNTRAVILMDETGEVGRSSGGTGKGLLMKCIGQMTLTSFIGAANFDVNNRFRYQELEEGARVLFLDEWKPQRTSFDMLFADITNGLSVEQKNQRAQALPFSRSPKFVLASNDIIVGDDDSSERRKVEIALAKRYSAKFTPKDEFGQAFFGPGWDADEWARFDNFMLSCVQHFMAHGQQLLLLKNESIAARGLAQTVGVTFHEFAAELLEQAREEQAEKGFVRLWLHEVYPDYQKQTGDGRLSAIQFGKKMQLEGFEKLKYTGRDMGEGFRGKPYFTIPPPSLTPNE